MNKISFPLKLRMKRPQVADLQDALQVLLDRGILLREDGAARRELSAALPRERAEQTYGATTRKLVSAFQQERRLLGPTGAPSGEVDEPTAKALNALLKELGVLDQPAEPAAPRSFVVSGEVRREDGLPMHGVQVRAVHEAVRRAIRLGEDTTDVEGRYSIRYEPLPGIRSINLRVTVLDADGKLLRDSDVIRRAKPLEIVDPIVPASELEPHQVEGKIFSRSSASVGGLRVVIVDKGVGGDVQLAETVTGEGGAFRATFSDGDLRRRGKALPDLQARVFAGDAFLDASDVHYNASNRETLNVALDDEASSVLASEHETLIGAIARNHKGQLGDLKESDDRQDITYLANKTGWDARAVALAALADQFSARTMDATGAPAIAPPLFYALFRAGLPANEDILYRTDAETLETVWTKAAEQGVIPSSITSTIPAALRQFQDLSAQKLLTGPALAGVSSLKEMLVSSRLTEAQQQQFAALYAANRTDIAAFWQAVGTAFGQDTATRLQLDGKLAFLTLNNAPLMQALHRVDGIQGLSDPLQLAQAGYHRAAKWGELLNADTPIPKEIPGDTPGAKRANYAEFLAAQVRLSYPTAAMAEMVKSGDLPVGGPDQVHGFLTEHQGKFEIGMQPVEQYAKRNNLQVAPEVTKEVARIQRVYQITPSDQAMTGLLKQGIDAAYHVVRFDKEAFVQRFAQDLGGADQAALVHERSQQVHNFTLNIATSYLTARNGIALGASPMMLGAQGSPDGGQVLRPAPMGASAENAADVIAYPTLESLFGSMDFCACDHCRSVLSPAAYLVDLLQCIDRDPNQQELVAGMRNPQAVLLERRPDIHHLPLTCENTNTALPYVDIVNETLEYFIANNVQKLSLEEYTGHDTHGVASEDLLASPQFVVEAAYTILRGERFPLPLPFHQPLENLRRFFEKFDVSLPLGMERLRKADELERGANPYGWRDILMEDLGLSREEHEILTDSAAVPLWRMVGFPHATADAAVIAALSNARLFARRVGVSYDELAALLRTRFINPNSDLIPKLERLGVPFDKLQALHDGTIADLPLPTGAGAPDPSQYDGDINAWVKDPENFARIMAIIVLADPTDTSTRIGAVEFVRLLRFLRLWKKTGWTIEQTDAAICALYRTDLAPLATEDIHAVAKLDAGFLTLLPRLGILVRVMKALNLTPDRDLLPLLACWSDIGTQGDHALYRQMFLNAAILSQDTIFADDGYGNFLKDATKKLLDHAEALRAAFNVTAEEFARIAAALGLDATTPLTVANISAIYRRGWLARKLRLSIRELLLLTSLTGLDPFVLPDPTHPAILRLIALVEALKARSLKSAAALYLIWNQDLSGKSAPDPRRVAEFARTLRGEFASIDDQFAVTEDPGGDVARARMALVNGQEASDSFFALLEDTIVLDVPYAQGTPALDAAITTVDPNIAYDDFRHRIFHKGLLRAPTRIALTAVGGVTSDFQNAVDGLFARSEDASGSFFTRYPELKPLYDAYIASTDPLEKKRSALLAAFRPELARRRKRQVALRRLSDAASVDISFAQTVLDPEAAPYPLHAAGQPGQPALIDVIALETQGLAAQFFFRETATGAVDLSVPAAANLDYSTVRGNALPTNPTPGAAVSGIWRGRVETSEPGYYNIVIEADAGATASLTLAGEAQPLAQNGVVWRNTNPLQLKGGRLYDITLTVEKVKDRLSVKWETPKRPREVIPGRSLYPPTILAPFSDVYVRFLKSVSLASGLRLTANEIAHFAADPDYQIGGAGWLNALPVSGDPTPPSAAALLKPFEALLDFARIKADLSPDDEQVLAILQDPAAATATPDSRLFALTHWDQASLSDVLARFGGTLASLAHFDVVRRVYDAFAVIRPIGVSGASLIRATTNAPDGGIVRDFQAALRARYAAAADWRDLIQPINDALRGLQRDALVAYILHQMREDPDTAQIDTPDKLFEYFLMDVQMEPCMLTSRIRHALSSVQLFIERCLMNLEPRVSPASINASQWTWMKRYRVWEANRKVFLWPENWLEPELRDDKSPFFKEIESELLQSDITEDSAATALLNYLAKLEEVAKLEPCGMYYVEPTDRKGEVIHLVARTAGAHRKYYYRRYEFGYWTPWEQIKLDIEDNPVLPVVWNDRLLLFWLRLLKKGPDTANKPEPGKKLTELETDDLHLTDPEITVQAVLSWSEYYNGKWQPAKTSDVNLPTAIYTSSPGVFDRAAVRLGVAVEGDALRVYIRDSRFQFMQRGGDGSVRFVEMWPGSFRFYNTHSLPVRGDDVYAVGPPLSIPVRRRDLAGDSTRSFALKYSKVTGPDVTREILLPQLPFGIINPRHELQDAWNSPFFFADSRHVFLVTTKEQPVWVRNYGRYDIFVNPDVVKVAQIPPLVVQTPPPPKPKFWGEGGPIGSDRGVVDPAPMQRLVTEDAYIRQGLGTTLDVKYGDRLIGPLGAIPAAQTRE
ncbi:MAG TPA: neuraminidase-like domain-containing protein [Anaerolineales bacterium]|nr:neuraminidase-like domain-containing protein [Anaerolineales bacterium]